MKVLAATVLSLSLLPTVPVLADQAQTIVITRSGPRPSQAGPAANFTGSVRVTPLFEAKDSSRGAGVDWLEKVSDEQYGGPPANQRDRSR